MTDGLFADGLVAGAVAGLVSGSPSAVWSLARGRGLTEVATATRAAGALLGRPGTVGGAVAHAGVSAFWGVVLSSVLPARRTVTAGLVAGGVIAVVDLGVVGRRVPEIRDLPVVPQVLDHLAFGAVAGAVLRARRRRPAA